MAIQQGKNKQSSEDFMTIATDHRGVTTACNPLVSLRAGTHQTILDLVFAIGPTLLALAEPPLVAT